MKVHGVNPKENSTVEIIVEVDAKAFDGALDKAYKKARRDIMVPGFRHGKAPRKMIERMYGSSVFVEDAINIIAPDVFEAAVEEKELKTVGAPSISDVDVADDQTLTLTFITGVYPEVVLGPYKDLSAEKPVETVKKKDIDAEIETLQKRNARSVSVKRKAKKGDTAVIDFEGFLDGNPFAGGKADGHELTLGSGNFVPGFEEQVIGMKTGEEKEINITFPEDYAEELAGKDVIFKVKCQDVKEQILPELDDEFAKDVSEFDTLEEYKKDIKERLTKERTERAEGQYREDIMKLAIEGMEVDVPKAMIDQMLDSMMRDFYYSISSQGMDPEQYLSMMGMNVESFREGSRANALARVKTGLLLDAIAAEEKLEATEEEIEVEFSKLAEQYQQKVAEIKKMIKAAELKGDILRRKASDLIYDNAKVKKAAAKKAGEEESETAAPAEKKSTAKKPAAKKAPAKTADIEEKKAPAKKASAEKKPAAKKAPAKKAPAKKTEE